MSGACVATVYAFYLKGLVTYSYYAKHEHLHVKVVLWSLGQKYPL